MIGQRSRNMGVRHFRALNHNGRNRVLNKSLSREWATPLTIGSFVLMAATGVLMFFHLDQGLNKLAHEWLGWFMVVAVALHATVNGLAFKRHVLKSKAGRGIVVASLAVLAGSFVSLPGSDAQAASPPALAIQALTRAPLAQVAPLTGKPADQLLSELAAAGVPNHPRSIKAWPASWAKTARKQAKPCA